MYFVDYIGNLQMSFVTYRIKKMAREPVDASTLLFVG